MTRYREIAADLRDRIHSGRYPVGGHLPTYAGLTRQYSVGRGVVSAALQLLEREGLVRIAKRAGIRVLDWRLDRRRIKRDQLVMRDPRRGYIFPAASHADEPWQAHGTPRRSYEPVPDPVAELLGIRPGLATLRRRRVTSPTGQPPFQIVDTWLSPEIVRDAPRIAESDTGPGGYIDRIEEAGHGPIRWTEHIRARAITAEEASLLDISNESTVIQLILLGTSNSLNRPIDVTMRVIPSDRIELVSQLHRDESAHWPVQPVAPPSES